MCCHDDCNESASIFLFISFSRRPLGHEFRLCSYSIFYSVFMWFIILIVRYRQKKTAMLCLLLDAFGLDNADPSGSK